MKELGDLLQKVGGGGVPGQPQPPAHHEADEVLRPLMDILVNIFCYIHIKIHINLLIYNDLTMAVSMDHRLINLTSRY